MSQWVNVNQNVGVTCNEITAIRQISAEACGGTAVESNLKLRPFEGRVAEDYGVFAVDQIPCYQMPLLWHHVREDVIGRRSAIMPFSARNIRLPAGKGNVA